MRKLRSGSFASRLEQLGNPSSEKSLWWASIGRSIRHSLVRLRCPSLLEGNEEEGHQTVSSIESGGYLAAAYQTVYNYCHHTIVPDYWKVPFPNCGGLGNVAKLKSELFGDLI
jgi:hypothetical protein